MAKPDRSIDPRILESAKEEFLDKGFLGASLNNICRKAGVTTGALYKRFKGKEELFSALVDDAVDALKKVREEKAALRDDITDEELWKAWNMDEGYMMWWFRFCMTVLTPCAFFFRPAKEQSIRTLNMSG